MITVRAYSPLDADDWDIFCGSALQSTLLHTRRFLSYHGSRFRDASAIIELDGKCIGLMPAAEDPNDQTIVVSHPGATYGGIVHRRNLRGSDMLAAMTAIKRHFAEQGFNHLIYKAVPTVYHQAPAQDDLHALLRLGAERVRCDLSSAIDLNHPLGLESQRLRSAKKAKKLGVMVAEGQSSLAPFWDVLQSNLAKKHNVKPVHTLEEITLLISLFPDQINCVCGYLDGELIAGTLLFITPTAFHAQYIASSELGQQACALDRVFGHAIELASSQGKRWFDFGISTEQQGRVLNDGLYRFKSGFGGGGVIHEFYELDLNI